MARRDPGRRGELYSSGLVLLNPRRTETIQRVTLAHELGHAHFGHTRTDHSLENAVCELEVTATVGEAWRADVLRHGVSTQRRAS